MASAWMRARAERRVPMLILVRAAVDSGAAGARPSVAEGTVAIMFGCSHREREREKIEAGQAGRGVDGGGGVISSFRDALQDTS